MKKRGCFLLLIFTILIISGCNSQNVGENSEQTEESNETALKNKKSGDKTLIAFFSIPETDGTDAVAGASRVVKGGEVLGNTEQVAMWISEATGGELFEIVPAQAYPANHDDLVAQADEEQEKEARPELASTITNLNDYDTIFVGYPIWWGDLPMPMYTFFEAADFSGKTIIPFSTHGGSGISGTASRIAELAPSATVVTDDSLTISRNDVGDAKEEVIDWVSGLGYSS